MNNLDTFLAKARAMRADGSEIESILAALRTDGATFIDSIRVVRLLEQLSLGRAKEVVDSSATWSAEYEARESLREAAWEWLENEEG